MTAAAPRGFGPEPVCRALVREGVLVRSQVSNGVEPQYVLSPHCSRMFDRLLDKNEAPPLMLN
jgi:hypothetical protein